MAVRFFGIPKNTRQVAFGDSGPCSFHSQGWRSPVKRARFRAWCPSGYEGSNPSPCISFPESEKRKEEFGVRDFSLIGIASVAVSVTLILLWAAVAP